MTDDGSDETRLTNNDANDFEPGWSPDGEKIAFSSFRDGFNDQEICYEC
jgi:Tol biopolymer transport system component